MSSFKTVYEKFNSKKSWLTTFVKFWFIENLRVKYRLKYLVLTSKTSFTFFTNQDFMHSIENPKILIFKLSVFFY